MKHRYIKRHIKTNETPTKAKIKLADSANLKGIATNKLYQQVDSEVLRNARQFLASTVGTHLRTENDR